MKIKGRVIDNILLFLIVSLQIIDCFSIYYKLIGYHVLQVLNIGLLLTLFLVHKGRLKLVKRDGYFLVLYVCVNAILFLFGDFKKLGYISGQIIPIILIYLILCVEKEQHMIEKIVRIYCNIILVVCAVSLIFYILGTVLGLLSYTNIYDAELIGWADFDYYSYFGMYIDGQRTFFFGRTIVRNIGIFIEAPVFAYVIVSALYFELFGRKEYSWGRIILLAVTIITTFSTTAITIGMILGFIFFYIHYMQRNIWKLVLPILAIIVINLAIVVVSDKLSVGNASGSARMDDMMACIKCFLDNPIVGTGFNNLHGLDEYRGDFRQAGNVGVSNGLPYVLANGGVLLGSIYFIPIISVSINLLRKKCDLKCWGFIATQCVLLVVTITEYTLLAGTFLAISWILCLNKKCDMTIK